MSSHQRGQCSPLRVNSYSVKWPMSRVARWYIFRLKFLAILASFGGPCNGRYLYVFLWQSGVFYGHMVYFVAIWYILCVFGTFFPVLVCCDKNNLAIRVQWTKQSEEIVEHIQTTHNYSVTCNTLSPMETSVKPVELPNQCYKRMHILWPIMYFQSCSECR
jgi:hypothetical protein